MVGTNNICVLSPLSYRAPRKSPLKEGKSVDRELAKKPLGWPDVTKTFLDVIQMFVWRARTFVVVKHFLPSLMFLSKAR